MDGVGCPNSVPSRQWTWWLQSGVPSHQILAWQRAASSLRIDEEDVKRERTGPCHGAVLTVSSSQERLPGEVRLTKGKGVCGGSREC